MSVSTTAPAQPRGAALDRGRAMTLAATECERVTAALRALDEDDWRRPTECPGWDVRAMAGHILGMTEMAGSMREQLRQSRAAARAGGGIDALTALQVDEHADLTPAQVLDRLAAAGPRAVRGRRRTPGFVRRRTLPEPQVVGGAVESWTIGFLTDVVLTRDPWMHRVDIARATGRDLVLTPDHDGVLVADAVAEWATRHGQPYRLRLTGPAGGQWSSGTGGESIECDAVEFCRLLSGRGEPPATGLLAVQVPF